MGLMKNDIIPIFVGKEVAIAAKSPDEPEVKIEELLEETKKKELVSRGRKRKIVDNQEGHQEVSTPV